MAAIVVLALAAVLALFYWVVAPFLIGNDLAAAAPWIIGFGALLYVLLWLLTFEYAFVVIAQIYRVRSRSLLGTIFRAHRLLDPPERVSRRQTLTVAVLSYLLTIYGFSVAYAALSSADVRHFGEKLGLGKALYFSVVTIATVGYGDVLPKTGFAQFVVASEILGGVFYAVFLFSLLASFLRE